MAAIIRNLCCMLGMVALLISGCQVPPAPTATATSEPQPSPTPMPMSTLTAPELFEIYPDQPLQTIKDIAGGNFIHQSGDILTALDPISKYNLETLQPRYGRVRIVLEEWEPVNDNDNPQMFNWDAFKDTRYNHATFLLMQEFQKRGIEISASVWRTPDWTVKNPKADSQRRIIPELMPEVVESIAAWLVKARDTYGVEVKYVSFNEANGGYSTLLPAPDCIALVRLASQRFAELGLQTRWFLGDTFSIQSTIAYVAPIWAAEGIRPAFGPLTFHSWDLEAPDISLKQLASFAQREGLDVWCTEVGWDAELWQTPERMATWEHALKLAWVYNRMLKLSGATVFQYWQMVGYDYNINDGVKPYPALEIIRQLADQLPPGTQIVATSPNLSRTFFFAARAPEHFVVHLVNAGNKPMSLTLRGIPEGEYTFILSTEGEVGREMGRYTSSVEGIGIELPAESVGYLTTSE